MSDLVNSLIGEYRLVEFLGAGGMGEVYRATHARLGREVAVKVLSTSPHDADFNQRFLNEARIQAELQHPNIATLYEFTEVAGRPCIIMEYVDGPTLADRIRSAGPLAPSEAVATLRSITEAVGYIHANGVVHRDLKSNNVKISNSGSIKLLDFGIAKRDTSPRLTAAGHFVGTIHYCSPEQLHGRPVDHRSDIWALGVLLYEMVTGRVPFDADSAQEFARAVESGRFAPPSSVITGIPPRLDDVIERCLQTRPDRRFQSTAQLIEALDGIGHRPSEPTAGPRISNKFTALLEPLRGRFGLMAVGAAAVVLLAIIIIGVWPRRGPEPTEVPAERARRPAPTSREKAGGSIADGSVVVTIGMVGGKAEVFVDGKRIGHSPCSFDAAVGHRIDIELRVDGYKPLRKNIGVLPHSNRYTYSIRDLTPKR